jgi:hypothetical protein
MGGRAYLIDAKSMVGHRLRFAAIPDHQAMHFAAAIVQGAGAGLVVWSEEERGAWLVPWLAIEAGWRLWRVGVGRPPASIGLEEMAPHRLPGGLRGYRDSLWRLIATPQ